ncbi:MAG: hypothetical protein AB1705_23650 [Verrucomicrobiota bacterium]
MATHLWAVVYGLDYDVPVTIAEHPLAQDVSHESDHGPLFRFGEDIHMRVAHPNPELREIDDERRFRVVSPGWVFITDDAEHALQAALQTTNLFGRFMVCDFEGRPALAEPCESLAEAVTIAAQRGFHPAYIEEVEHQPGTYVGFGIWTEKSFAGQI